MGRNNSKMAFRPPYEPVDDMILQNRVKKPGFFRKLLGRNNKLYPMDCEWTAKSQFTHLTADADTKAELVDEIAVEIEVGEGVMPTGYQPLTDMQIKLLDCGCQTLSRKYLWPWRRRLVKLRKTDSVPDMEKRKAGMKDEHERWWAWFQEELKQERHERNQKLRETLRLPANFQFPPPEVVPDCETDLLNLVEAPPVDYCYRLANSRCRSFNHHGRYHQQPTAQPKSAANLGGSVVDLGARMRAPDSRLRRMWAAARRIIDRRRRRDERARRQREANHVEAVESDVDSDYGSDDGAESDEALGQEVLAGAIGQRNGEQA